MKERSDRDVMILLHEIGEVLGSAANFEQAVNKILKLLCERAELDRGTLSLAEDDSEVAIDIAYGLSKSEMQRGRYKVGEGITGRVVQSGKPVIVPRISSEPLFLDRTGSRGKTQKSETSFVGIAAGFAKLRVGRRVQTSWWSAVHPSPAAFGSAPRSRRSSATW